MEEIILEALIEEYKVSRQPIISIENSQLYITLCQKLGIQDPLSDDNTLSNKKPRQILDDLGLIPNKENLGNVHGRRWYHIQLQSLMSVLSKKGYLELLERLKSLTLDTPTSPTTLTTLTKMGGDSWGSKRGEGSQRIEPKKIDWPNFEV